MTGTCQKDKLSWTGYHWPNMGQFDNQTNTGNKIKTTALNRNCESIVINISMKKLKVWWVTGYLHRSKGSSP